MPFDNKAFDMGNDPIWEPIEKLEMAPVDPEGEIFNGEDGQEYCCYVIGHCLNDPEACCSIIEINTGFGKNNDETLAKMILSALKFKRAHDSMMARQQSLF